MLPRRSFLGCAAAGAVIDPATASLPTVRLGKYTVTRLIAGYNPVGGYSHSVPKLSAIMKDWFTPQRTLEFVKRVEQAGINTWQAGPDPKVIGALRAAWEGGSKMQWISLMADGEAKQWKEIADLKPVAVVHHGEITDRMFRAGEQAKIRDFINRAHDLGLQAGISSHNPENIARCEEAGWGQDLYMTCFYNIRRDQEKVRAGLGGPAGGRALSLQGSRAHDEGGARSEAALPGIQDPGGGPPGGQPQVGGGGLLVRLLQHQADRCGDRGDVPHPHGRNHGERGHRPQVPHSGLK